jgi:hypothetical protein
MEDGIRCGPYTKKAAWCSWPYSFLVNVDPSLEENVYSSALKVVEVIALRETKGGWVGTVCSLQLSTYKQDLAYSNQRVAASQSLGVIISIGYHAPPGNEPNGKSFGRTREAATGRNKI